jgi:type IV pilus assembly protein PilQ
VLFVTDIPSRLDAVRRLVGEIDKSPRQVLIEARVVEATRTFSRDLGVRLAFGKATPWKLNNGGAQVGFGSSSFGQFTPGTAESGGGSFQPEGYGSLSLSIFNSSVSRFLNLELQALESDGRGRVVSSPRILTANLGNATIKQGSKIPIRDCETNGGIRECDVDFVDALLSLDVTPSITPDGRVQLTVKVNKDRPDFSYVVDNTPLIETKEVVTTITVENGGTVLLGGVFEEQDLSGEDRVPVLGEVPVLGALFRTRSNIQEKKELLVFITPRLVSDSLNLR